MKHLLFPVTIVLMVLGLSSCAPKAAQFNTAEVKKYIDAENVKFGESMMKDNTDASMALYQDDAPILPANMPVMKGKEAIRAFYGGMSKTGIKITDAKFTAQEVNGSGEHAYEIGRYTMSINFMGKAEADTGKYLAVWKKQADGSWKFLADSWSSDRPIPMEVEKVATKKK